MHLRHLVLIFGLFPLASPAFARQESLKSPDAILEFTVSDDEGRPQYAVLRLGEPVVESSQLGLVFKTAPALTQGLAVSSVSRSEVDQTWTQPWGEVAEVRDQHHRMLVSFRTSGGRGFDLEVRLYDDGLGFRYLLAADGDHPERFIIDESTEFALAEPGTVWWIEARRHGVVPVAP